MVAGQCVESHARIRKIIVWRMTSRGRNCPKLWRKFSVFRPPARAMTSPYLRPDRTIAIRVSFYKQSILYTDRRRQMQEIVLVFHI